VNEAAEDFGVHGPDLVDVPPARQKAGKSCRVDPETG
jgi:hypothetical protein